MARKDRITELRIQGVRVLKDLKLKFAPLTVLIGENGAGKSSIVEVCRLLNQVPRYDGFVSQFLNTHGGFYHLLRRGETKLKIGVTVEGDGPKLTYDLTLASEGLNFVLESESLVADEPSDTYPVFFRDRSRGNLMDEKHSMKAMTGDFRPDPLLGWFAMGGPPEIRRMADALNSIDVQLPFGTIPQWAARLTRRPSDMRGSVLLQPAVRLALFGENLPNAYQVLRNKPPEHWARTLDYVKLGLGDDVENVEILPDPGGGAVALALRWRGTAEAESVYTLSDGQLSYLAMVAIFRLESPFSLFVFDEPDLHLHPGLLARVLDMFQSMSERGTVLLTTHSDHLLDALEDAAGSARLLNLNARRETEVSHPDKESLDDWLQDYTGLGELRNAGHAPAIFVPDSGDE